MGLGSKQAKDRFRALAVGKGGIANVISNQARALAVGKREGAKAQSRPCSMALHHSSLKGVSSVVKQPSRTKQQRNYTCLGRKIPSQAVQNKKRNYTRLATKK